MACHVSIPKQWFSIAFCLLTEADMARHVPTFFMELGGLVGGGVVGLAIETRGDAYVFLEKTGKV